MTMKSPAIAAIALLALSLAACSTQTAAPTASDNDPFNFVYVGGVTGALSSIATVEVVALKGAVEQLNDKGGILGKKVVMEVLDTKSDPTEAVSVLQKRLASGDKPELIRAGLGTNDALALIPLATRAGIATYTSSASPLLDDPETYPLNTGLSAPFSRQLGLIKTYSDDQKYKKVAVLASEDAAGDSAVAAIEDNFKGSSATLDIQRYNGADIDLSVAYQRAVAGDPDLIYSNCIGAPCTRIVAARESVKNGTDVPMIGDISMAGSGGGVAANVPATSIENLHILIWDAMVKRPESEQTSEFKAFYKAVSAEGPPSSVSAPGIAYDGLMMYAAAAEYAKSTDSKKMVKAIKDIKWEAGAFSSYGNAVLDFTEESQFPVLPDDAFVIVQVAPLDEGQYPAEDLYSFE
jgi:branched-chain amino acid transport system substrate-binding protein